MRPHGGERGEEERGRVESRSFVGSAAPLILTRSALGRSGSELEAMEVDDTVSGSGLAQVLGGVPAQAEGERCAGCVRSEGKRDCARDHFSI